MEDESHLVKPLESESEVAQLRRELRKELEEVKKICKVTRAMLIFLLVGIGLYMILAVVSVLVSAAIALG